MTFSSVIRKLHRSKCLVALALAVIVAPAHGAEPSWRLEQPPPPPGAVFPVPLGAPGDIKFWAPNRGLIAVQGNESVAAGLFAWNGAQWSQLSVVCGSDDSHFRIAWAGPTEFWTIAQPSPPRGGGSLRGDGLALCHYRDGQVIGSYSTPASSDDPFRTVNAASCAGPSNCWFGGIVGQTPDGSRAGAFHLVWNGETLTTVFAPQGRAVSDIEAFGERFIETAHVGVASLDVQSEPVLTEPEPKPSLLHWIDSAVFSNDPFVPAARTGVPDNGTELLAADAAGSTDAWAVGGGSVSGVGMDPTMPADRPPLAVHWTGSQWRGVALDETLFTPGERFVDVAVLPQAARAMIAVQPYAERRSASAKARGAFISQDGTVERFTLPVGGAGLGSAARVECVSASDCWLATYGGWVFHWTTGDPLAIDAEPAFQRLITARPNEAAEQFVGDGPPDDDSLLFAPPPLAIELPPIDEPLEPVRRLRSLISHVTTKLKGRRTLEIRFRLARPATIGVAALRKKRAVACARPAKMRPGSHRIKLRLNPRRWPTRLKMITREQGAKAPAVPRGCRS